MRYTDHLISQRISIHLLIKPIFLSAVVRSGTMVVWFNGDVDHDHKITLTNNLSPGNIFKDLRGGQSGTGDEQTLVLWTSAGKNIDEITSKLQRDINGFYNIHKLTPL